MRQIPLVDLKAQYLSIKDEIDAALQRVLTKAVFILGEEVEAFEDEYAGFCGIKYCVGVASGTAALHLALLACKVGTGDEVITSPFTFTATAEAIFYCGAKPVFVDIDPATYNIDPTKIEAAITERTKAIIPVHLYGQPADMDPILDIAGRYGLKVVEDAAQAHGAEYKGKRTGGLGDVACFSFYPGKNLGAYGDAGAVVTNDEAVAESVRLLRDHGRKAKYEHLQVGYSERLDAIQAAILRVKLKHLELWNSLRRNNAQIYRELLRSTGLALPKEAAGNQHVYHLFVVRLSKRDALRTYLRVEGIASGIHYPVPLHLLKAYGFLGYREGDFPVAEEYGRSVLSLPLFPEMEKNDIEAICETIKQYLDRP